VTNSVTPELLSALCHELRGPLGALGNWVHVLGASEADEKTRARALEGLRDGVRTMGTAFDLIAAFTSLQSAAKSTSTETEAFLKRLVEATPESSLVTSREGEYVLFIVTLGEPARLPLTLARALCEHQGGETILETLERGTLLRLRLRRVS
jgi:signal transduction histidine kinase